MTAFSIALVLSYFYHGWKCRCFSRSQHCDLADRAGHAFLSDVLAGAFLRGLGVRVDGVRGDGCDLASLEAAGPLTVLR